MVLWEKNRRGRFYWREGELHRRGKMSQTQHGRGAVIPKRGKGGKKIWEVQIRNQGEGWKDNLFGEAGKKVHSGRGEIS